MDLLQFSTWDQTYVADPDSAHDGQEAAGEPTRVVDAWEVSSLGVAYYPVPVTSALWEQARLSPGPAHGGLPQNRPDVPGPAADDPEGKNRFFGGGKGGASREIGVTKPPAVRPPS